MDYYKINKSCLLPGSVLFGFIKEYCSQNSLLLSDYIDNQLAKYRKYIDSKEDGTKILDYRQSKCQGEIYYQVLVKTSIGYYSLHSFSVEKHSLHLISTLREIL